jgi:hypothetical protein
MKLHQLNDLNEDDLLLLQGIYERERRQQKSRKSKKQSQQDNARKHTYYVIIGIS